MRGVNDDELAALSCSARGSGAEVRFIEDMDVGGATRWTPAPSCRARDPGAARCGLRNDIDAIVEEKRPPRRTATGLPCDGTVFGIISSTTQPFCGTCDRARLTADGLAALSLCHGGPRPPSVRWAPRRQRRGSATGSSPPTGPPAPTVARRNVWAMDRQTTLIPLRHLKKDAHLEMHTRGG